MSENQEGLTRSREGREEEEDSEMNVKEAERAVLAAQLESFPSPGARASAMQLEGTGQKDAGLCLTPNFSVQENPMPV